MTAQDRWDQDRVDHAALAQDVWLVLARARAQGMPRTLAAAQETVFEQFLPMARALATDATPTHVPVDPVAAERAAELGLAQAVLGWRVPDGAGFEVFAAIAVAAELDHLPSATQPQQSPPGRGRAGGWRRTGTAPAAGVNGKLAAPPGRDDVARSRSGLGRWRWR